MDNIDNKKISLRERYNKEFLDKAEARRDALKYKRIHVGQINNGRLEHLLKLLYQAHQNYYFGYFEASCALAGSMLEQSLMILLEEKIKKEGFVSIKRYDGKKTRFDKIENVEDLSQCNMGVLISIVNHYKMFNPKKYKLAKTLQNIRNCVVHDMLPEFSIKDGYYEAEVKISLNSNIKSVLKIEEIEINNYTAGRDSIELWAYFLLTRTRSLIEFLFRERVKKFPPDF